MSELAKKLHIKQGSTTQEVKIYSSFSDLTLPGYINAKVEGIKGYIQCGSPDDKRATPLKVTAWQLNQPGLFESNVLTASEDQNSIVLLKAYRNDGTFMQDLPSLNFQIGQVFYLNNENAPTIEGYDFVCCDKNNVKIEEPMEVKVYYIPQSIEDRTKTSWKFWGGFNPRGDLFNTDYVNTYGAINTSFMFYYSQYMSRAPKLNLSNVFNADSMFSMSTISKIDFNYYDTSKIQNMAQMFKDIPSLTTITGSIDMSSCTYCNEMFTNTGLTENIHLRNVRRTLDLSKIGAFYIIDNYIDDDHSGGTGVEP